MSQRIKTIRPGPAGLVAAVFGAALASGCAHSLPSAGFDGFAIKQLKPKVAQAAPLRVESIAMDLQFDFVVRNPTSRPLVVPEHEFKLDLGNAYTATHTVPKQTVEPSSVLRLQYPIHLDLNLQGNNGLKSLLGRDVPYSFSAEAKLDLPEMLGGEGGKAVDQALSLAGIKDDKLVLKHEGTLRLPLPPAIERSTALPTVQFLGKGGQQVGKDVSAELTSLRQQLAPFVAAFDRALTARLGTQIDGRTLMKLVVGDRWTDQAISALQFARIPVNTGNISLPGIPSTPLDALKAVDPSLGDQWSRFHTAWNGFDPSKFSGVIVPTSLPHGVRITIPVKIRNPNTFPIKLPGLQMAAFGGPGGMQLASLQAVAKEEQGKPPDAAMEPFELAGSASTDLMLTSELSWDQFGGLLEGMHGNMPPVRLKGQVMVDLGVGQVTLPVDVSP